MTETDRLTGLVGYSGMKVPVLVATTAAITLSGEQTIDGVACVTGDRVLVKDQASGVDNGIHVVDTGDWELAKDADGLYDYVFGTLVPVASGTVSARTLYMLTTTGTITPGTSSLTFTSTVSLAAPIAIASGGTGAITAALARTALGAGIGFSTATASVAAHATTTDVWTAERTVLTGGAVTFTDIADAPYAGAVAWVKQNAAHVWTDGAVFDVQGGSSYTAAAGDWLRIYATTVSTFEITVFRADDGAAIKGTTASTFTFNGTGSPGSTGSLTMTCQKIGNKVTVNVPACLATTGTTSTTLTSNTALAAAFRPTIAQVCPIARMVDNGASFAGTGLLNISTGGILTIYKDGTTTAAFTNTAVGGFTTGQTFTFFVG